MNGTTLLLRNDVYEIGYIKKAFKEFMEFTCPKLKTQTVSTYCSDAFFILEQLPDKWVKEIVYSTVGDDELQDKLRTYIRNDITGARVCPDKDARSYTKHFWQLIKFLRILSIAVEGRVALPRRIGA